MATGRGYRNGKITETIARLLERPREQLTATILMDVYGLDRRQAWHVLEVAKDKGLIRAVTRGVYEMAS